MCRSSTRNVPVVPFGDTLTCPSAPSGAVATKNTGCRSNHAASRSSIPSITEATGDDGMPAAVPAPSLFFAPTGAGPCRATRFPAVDLDPGRAVQPARRPRARHHPDCRARASYSSTEADTDTLSESAVPSIGTATRSKPCSYQPGEIPYRSDPTTSATRPE